MPTTVLERAGSAFLIHWNREEADQYARTLQSAGWRVATETGNNDVALTRIVYSRPDVVLILLAIAPKRGIRTAYSIRCLEATSNIPIVFVGDDSDVQEEARRLVPDATYVSMACLRNAFRSIAVTAPPAPAPQATSILSHIILEVRNVERSAQIYREALGLCPVQQSEASGEWLTLSAGPCRITLRKQSHPEACRGTQLTFRVTDVIATLDALQEAGACMEGIRRQTGLWTCEGMDPDGNHLRIEACCTS